MKSLALCTVIAALSLSLVAADVQAKRLGGGGMKRSVPTQPAKPATPPQNAPAQQQNAAPQQAAAPTAGAGAAAAPKRSWMGPVAGLAAGLGLAALASHFGFGEALANIMTMVLLGLVVMVVIGFVMRRMAAKKAAPQGMQFAGAGAPFGQAPAPVMPAPMAMPAGSSAPVAAALASDFDTSGFEQIAKRVFIRMQAANDAGDQNDLRRFTTPEMYASIQQELLDRKGTQRTDVLELQAQVVERVEEQGEQIVSVRFSGLIREQSESAAQPFDEVWHLVRPLDESREWAIAGIQAMA
ncbi:Tim44-like domain-containing protein [Paucibacter sp. PLA-PC-4]|uniref:Tim44 domain-containing protein n=1 Tax=Paucibacter sp. PLA-PC-4 TaxID=2993655 RepID=UPI00224ABB7B|nr:Tim44-like domain-containing protein [Paucibacter sp. PLA-PC-4]MCX2865233.1 Tim44-like domain-containing protein [Paucibacter sp. PLA-PC-4]